MIETNVPDEQFIDDSPEFNQTAIGYNGEEVPLKHVSPAVLEFQLLEKDVELKQMRQDRDKFARECTRLAQVNQIQHNEIKNLDLKILSLKDLIVEMTKRGTAPPPTLFERATSFLSK